MSIIQKEYWTLDENPALEPYRLGQVINAEDEEANLILKRSDEQVNDYEYIGDAQYLWTVSIKDNIVNRIIYRENFPVPNVEFWENHYSIISENLKSKNRLVDENYKGDRMFIVVRDGFVRLIFLIKGQLA